MNSTLLEREIIDYYETCAPDYSLVWHLKSHAAMHYGYWEPETKRLRDALWNMNEKVAELAGIKSGDLVLDAGCGVGGSAFYLANTRLARVKGITLSQKHVDEANASAKKQNLQDLVQFSVRNFCNTGFAENTFDVVWAIESVCHAEEKEQFIQEALRILKPGGRLVVADFFQNENQLPIPQSTWMDNWAQSWAVPAFEPKEIFKKKMINSGFTEVLGLDVTSNIMKSAKRLRNYFVPGLIADGALRMMGMRGKIANKNLWSTFYQYKTLKANLWSYHFFTGIKNK